MYNIGDKVKENNGQLVWTIVNERLDTMEYRIESSFNGLRGTTWVSNLTLMLNYTIVKTTSDDTDVYGDWKLLAGESNTKQECCTYHDWKKYIGFKETYEFCTKCDEKRPWEP